MRINLIQNYNNYSTSKNSNLFFGRALTEKEKPECEKSCKEALDILGVKNLSLILHGSSFPADKRDFYIGSFFNERAKDLNNFVSMFGFNSIQLGPNGMISVGDVSPYGGKAFSHNYLFIDLNKLATEEYGEILDETTLNSFKNTTHLTDETDFNKAFIAYDNLLYTAYKTMKYKAYTKDKSAQNLRLEFAKYKGNTEKWLASDALYDVLSKKVYNNKPISQWQDLDKNLYKYVNDFGHNHSKHEEALNRVVQLELLYDEDIELYKFKQFLYSKQLKEFNKEMGGKVDLIGDALVGFSESDVWANPDAFLDGYSLGCPGGGPNNSHQAWNIPVIDPKKLFDKDGNLLAGGKLLQQKFEHILKHTNAVRIDHAIGLLDPWVYEKSSLKVESNGSILTNGRNVSELPHIDPDKNFSKVIEKIILPLLDKYGVDKNDVVWEDLGSQTNLFKQKYYNELKLPGIKNLKWEQAEHVDSRHWWLVGSHDNPPLSFDIDKSYVKYVRAEENGGQQSNKAFKPIYLAGFLYPDWSNEQRNDVILKIRHDARERLKYKFVEMLANGKNIQISFMDFFGLNKVYNYMGTQDARNWKLRLTPQFDKDYYKTVENRAMDKIALNMPEILANALKSRLSWKKINGKDNDVENENIESLINKLSNFANILYEKS